MTTIVKCIYNYTTDMVLKFDWSSAVPRVLIYSQTHCLSASLFISGGDFCFCVGMPIHSFQSRDRLEDLEGKTSIELLHKRVNFSSVSQQQIFRSPLNRIKGISEQNASFGHLQSILSTRGNISIINSATKCCKNT